MELKKPTIIGVVHLPALPGSPQWKGSMTDAIAHVRRDVAAYRDGGIHALVLENYHDIPFAPDSVPPETVAAMARILGAIESDLGDIPYGFNVLRNDARSGLGLCAACGGSFIRVNVHTGAMITDQGLIQGNAFTTLRERERLCPDVKIFADVHVKHAVPLGTPDIGDSAHDALHRGLADGLVVSGTGTGLAVDAGDLKAVRAACPEAFILIGSGASLETAPMLLTYADALIVGTSLKVDGRTNNPVDAERVRALMQSL